jgi:hypothetical protein
MADAAGVYLAHPTDEEIADVLSQRLVATVGTLNRDGTVHLAYVIFRHADARMYFETSSMTRKARNVERTGQASVVVQGRAASGHSLMVSMEGSARIIRGEQAHELNRRLREKYLRPGCLGDVDRAWSGLDDTAVEITPRRRRSWTSAVFHEHTEAQVGVPFDEIWLPDE